MHANKRSADETARYLAPPSSPQSIQLDDRPAGGPAFDSDVKSHHVLVGDQILGAVAMHTASGPVGPARPSLVRAPVCHSKSPFNLMQISTGRKSPTTMPRTFKARRARSDLPGTRERRGRTDVTHIQLVLGRPLGTIAN